VSKLAERVRDLERHFSLATKDLDKTIASLEKVTERGRRIDSVEIEEVPGQSERPALAVASR
jgi:hypothetical protein